MNTEHHIDELFARLNDAAQDEALRVAGLEVPRPPSAREQEDYLPMLSEWMAEYRHALLPVILRLRDWPDTDIEKLVRDGDLQIGEPTRVKGITVRMSLETMAPAEGRESTHQGILLPDLAATSEVLSEIFLALSAASRPLGQDLEPPEGIVSKGSVGFSVPGGGLLASGIGLIVIAASGLIATPVPAYIGGAALSSIGMIDKWLEWHEKWLDIRKKRIEVDNVRASQSDGEGKNSTGHQGGFAPAVLVPRHLVQTEAEQLGLTEECANHLLNRCLPIAHVLRERIPNLHIEKLSKNPLVYFPTPGPTFRPPLPGFTDTLKDGTYGPEMIKIPAGRFLMGSPESENDRRSDEAPQHGVTVGPFAIGKFPVTFEEFDKFAHATGSEHPSDSRWGRGRRPVINVSWEDAVKYTEWLSDETGKHYRLPSEAEWEYAARAGTQTRWSFGDEESDLDIYAWWDGNSNGQTHPVGEKAANPWGLYEVHGNVWEWVQDCWHDNYQGAPTDGSAWEQGDDGDRRRRVVRGGSWSSKPVYLRSASRNWSNPANRLNNLGFRLAQDL